MTDMKLILLLAVGASGAGGMLWLERRLAGWIGRVSSIVIGIVVAWLAGGVGPVLAILIAIGVTWGYLLSLRLHPEVACKACQGAKRHFGSVYPEASRACRACRGSGLRLRWGVKHGFGGPGRW